MRTLQKRIGEHLIGIRTKGTKSEVYRHFNSAGHNGTEDVEIYALDFIYRHPKSKSAKGLRDLIESNWINKLSSTAPNGLNIMDADYG